MAEDRGPLAYPFAALIAQQALQEALLLAAIDPAIGGVLISGPRGTAKSTSARALAAILPLGAFVNLPLGSSESQLIGTLNLEKVLQHGEVDFAPGLLAKAHLGVLYVDEVNLLPDTLADSLLDVASSGINRVEREGVSHQHAARFVLIGTMNPEEGALRPQLSDRFGLHIRLDNCHDLAVRRQIMQTRMAFDTDRDAFCRRYDAQQAALRQSIVAAQARLGRYVFDDAICDAVSHRCIAAHVDGMRADLVMLKAARALAAMENAAALDVSHVDRVAQSVLSHRRQDHGGAAHAGASQSQPPQQPQQMQPAPPQTPMETPAQSPAHAGSLSMADPEKRDAAAAASDDLAPDWGYIAPEPVGTTAVKPLRPFFSKKV